MKALNWPNLMATTSQLYLVNKSYLEYSSLDTYYPKVYKDATNAMKYWRGDSTRYWGVHIQKAKDCAEAVLEDMLEDNYYDQSDEAVQAIQSNASKVMELVVDILNCKTFDDLIALGQRNEAVNGSDYDLFENAYIELNPEIGRFRWEANYSTDETYAYHADMRDLSLMNVSD